MSEACQLYLISPPAIEDVSSFADAFSLALSGGPVAAFQLRLKSLDGTTPARENVIAAAAALQPIAAAHEVAFILNDDPELAREIAADGVHVGQSDTPYPAARAAVGEEATVGVTCHDSMHLAMEAAEAGADYVAFGAFYPTKTKAASTRASLSLLEDWSTATTVPCVAIGGITPENCEPLIAAGADFLAVSGAVWRHIDGPAAAVEKINEAFARQG